MTCHISNQIAKYCDEPEQESAWEKYQYLDKNDFVNINGVVYFWNEIDDMIYYPDCDTASESEDEVTKLYIDKIAELMNE